MVHSGDYLSIDHPWPGSQQESGEVISQEENFSDGREKESVVQYLTLDPLCWVGIPGFFALIISLLILTLTVSLPFDLGKIISLYFLITAMV
jgi:hypothetical protein